MRHAYSKFRITNKAKYKNMNCSNVQNSTSPFEVCSRLIKWSGNRKTFFSQWDPSVIVANKSMKKAYIQLYRCDKSSGFVDIISYFVNASFDKITENSNCYNDFFIYKHAFLFDVSSKLSVKNCRKHVVRIWNKIEKSPQSLFTIQSWIMVFVYNLSKLLIYL